MLNQADLAAVWLTIKLAGTATAVLLLLGTPLAWWLARTRHWAKGMIGALVTFRWCCRQRFSASTCWC